MLPSPTLHKQAVAKGVALTVKSKRAHTGKGT